MHTYVFDVKMYAIVEIQATCRAEAENMLGKFVDDPLQTQISNQEGCTIKSASLYEDDSRYPYLTVFDGVELDLLDEPIDIV